MNLTHFRFETDADGVATLTWDSPGRSMNVITTEVMTELDSVIDTVVADAAIKGCVIVSGKETFSGGADLTMLQGLGIEFERIKRMKGEKEAMKVFFEESRRLTLLYRKLETCGKPFVATVHGTCLGGAFELALACHYRVVSDSDKTRVGLPEIKVGLFPGAGGTTRVARLMQTGDALQMLLKGEQLRPAAAKSMGLVHEVAPRDEIIGKAKAWILGGGAAKAPWDLEGFKLPSKPVHSPAGMMIWPPANAIYRRETNDNYPAARAMLQTVYEGLMMPFDIALRIESRYFAHVLRSKEAAMMIRSLFISKGELDKGARRPKSVPAGKVSKIGIVGAGFMGASIGYVAALNGLEVVLIDRDQEAADKGKALSHKNMSDQIMKGRAKTAERDALLERITATTDFAALAGCDLVIEAVFEDRSVKADVLPKIAAAVGPETIIASNTSTLPISSLAENVGRRADFLGVHFFSPVEKMMLVEVIIGKQTGDRALAVALDFVRAIKKTPIVVNDGRGFFANRCVLNYIREGHLMLTEGIPASVIEQTAKAAGMPVGPLSLNDEVALDLAWKIVQATKKDLGAAAIDAAQEKLLEELVVKRERLGRKNGKGFYEYAGREKKLWPSITELQPALKKLEEIDLDELKHRFLVTQALEAAKTVEDTIITDPREADVGSILGFGFAPFTGGVLSYIDGMGVESFVGLAEMLAQKHGPRFKPCKLLIDMAKTGDSFYQRFAPAKAA